MIPTRELIEEYEEFRQEFNPLAEQLMYESDGLTEEEFDQLQDRCIELFDYGEEKFNDYEGFFVSEYGAAEFGAK